MEKKKKKDMRLYYDILFDDVMNRIDSMIEKHVSSTCPKSILNDKLYIYNFGRLVSNVAFEYNSRYFSRNKFFLNYMISFKHDGHLNKVPQLYAECGIRENMLTRVTSDLTKRGFQVDDVSDPSISPVKVITIKVVGTKKRKLDVSIDRTCAEKSPDYEY